MTIAAESARVSYDCNGSLTDFDFTFKIFNQEDLKVILSDSTGAETVLALTTDFTVEGENGEFINGGTVTTVKEVSGTMEDYAYASGYKITIMLDVDLEQETDLIYSGNYSSEAIETMSDRLTKICQQLAEITGRAVKFKATSTEVEIEIEDLVANMFIRVNSTGDGLEMGASSCEVDGDKISNTVYGASWNGVNAIAPSKNAVYNKIETLLNSIVSDDPYDATAWDGEQTTSPSKNAVRDKIESLSSGLGSIISRTIASGAITLADSEKFVALTGQGDTTDTLTAITKTGGGHLSVGTMLVLKGKASLGYTITIEDGTYLHLQADFGINSEYDTITLVSQGSGHFLEMSRASNA